MPEPTYDVYRPTRHPRPEPPVEQSRPATYDRRPERGRGGWDGPYGRYGWGGWSGRGGIPAPFVPGAICSVIWLVSGGGYFWPMWVLLPAVLMVLGLGRGCGRHHH